MNMNMNMNMKINTVTGASMRLSEQAGSQGAGQILVRLAFSG
jgi:hypothetical protein